MASVLELKSMLNCGGISLEEYHYLFPRLMEQKYELGDFSLFSFQLNLGENPNLICSKHPPFDLGRSSKELAQRKEALDLALFLNRSRPRWYADLDDTKRLDWYEKVWFHFSLFSHSLGASGIGHVSDFYWGDFFEDYPEREEEDLSENMLQCTEREIGIKFAEFVSEHVGSEGFSREKFAMEVEEYLNPFNRASGIGNQFNMKFYLSDGYSSQSPHMRIFMTNDNYDSMLFLIGGRKPQTL